MIAALVARAVALIAPYKFVAIGLALIAAVAFVDRKATYRERAKCDAATVRSELAAVRKDLVNEKRARAEDQKAIGELAQEKQKAEDSNATLRDEIKKLPVGDQCIVPPDRARRMR